jgi:hypothetical protein
MGNLESPVEDITPATLTDPDYWMVWEGREDYYGDRLAFVCRTRDAAIRRVVTMVMEEHHTPRDLAIEGSEWDDATPDPMGELAAALARGIVRGFLRYKGPYALVPTEELRLLTYDIATDLIRHPLAT